MSHTFFPILSNSLLFLILIGIGIKDVKEGIIPDILLLLLAALGLLTGGVAHSLSILILGGIGYGLYRLYPLLRGRAGLGLGDVKMMAASGLWVDPLQTPFFLLMSGGVGVGIAVLWQILKKGSSFPLGPALALALGICIGKKSGVF